MTGLVQAFNPLDALQTADQLRAEKEPQEKGSAEAFRKFLEEQKKIALASMQLVNNPASMLDADGGSSNAKDILTSVNAFSEIFRQEFKLNTMGDKQDMVDMQRQATEAAMLAAYGGKVIPDLPTTTIQAGGAVKYVLSDSVKKAEIVIRQGDKIVLSKEADGRAGKNKFVWDGKNTEGEKVEGLCDVELRLTENNHTSFGTLLAPQTITKAEKTKDGIRLKAGDQLLDPKTLKTVKFPTAVVA